MISCREFFLQEYLPTTSDTERELWFRTSDTAQRFVEIMRDYGQQVADECLRQVDYVDMYWDTKRKLESNIEGVKSKL